MSGHPHFILGRTEMSDAWTQWSFLMEKMSEDEFLGIMKQTEKEMRPLLLLPHIVPEDFAPFWDLTMSNEAYHRDKTAVSSTGLKEILKSPRAFLNAHTGKFRNEESDAFRVGTAVHMAILQPDLFAKSFVIAPKFSGVGAVKAKADWRMTLPSDSIILKEDEYQDLQEMINSVLRHRDACNMLKHGKAELSGYFRDPDTGIKCRIRPDFWHEGRAALMDVKTTRNVELSEFSKSIWNFRYDFQLAMYCLGISQITGKKVEYPLYLAIEKKPPYEVAVYVADDQLLRKGEVDYKLAMGKLKDCLEANIWSDYQAKMQMINLPRWAFMENFT